MGRLLNAWRLVCEAQAPTFKVKKALHKQQIKAANLLEAVPEAVRAGIVTNDEAEQIKRAEQARLDAIQVDVFDKDDYYLDTLSDIPVKTRFGSEDAGDDETMAEPALARAAND